MKEKEKKEKAKDISEMTEEEIQAPIRKFKTKTLPMMVAVTGMIAAVFYMLWVFHIIG